MGTVKVTNIEPIADNGTVTLGSSGDTIDLSTATNKLAPNTGQLRFIASTTNQTTLTTQNVFYKTTWNEQLVDNFNEFSSTDYRLTASEAGTYLFYFCKSIKWWSWLELNQRHKPFQGSALPTELRDQQKGFFHIMIK